MLEIFALVSCFSNLNTGLITECRVTNPAYTVYWTKEDCERAKISLMRHNQCFGGCQQELDKDGNVADNILPGQPVHTTYSCWKSVAGRWQKN